MKQIINEFKTFALKGNVIDLAIGIIIGAGFSQIVNPLVYDIVMPPIGFLLGKVDFSGLYINISGADYESLAAAKSAGAATINYGAFINTCISFFITACAVFVVVRIVNKLKSTHKHTEPVLPDTKTCSFCMSTVSLRATRCPQCTSTLQ